MAGHLLVTGGSRGIGAAVSRLAAARGYDVSINYAAKGAAAEALRAEIEAAGGRAVALAADVADPAEVERLFFEAEAALGPVTALVNSAGITGRIAKLAESDPAVIDRVVRVNVTGTILCAREAVRRMARSRGGQGGAIVNLSSAAANLGSPGEYVWYAASKGAIDSFTLGLAKEVGPEGIRVNAVAPGIIETEIHAASGNPDRLRQLGPSAPLGRAGLPEEVAEPILFLLSEAAAYISGAVLRIGGGR